MARFDCESAGGHCALCRRERRTGHFNVRVSDPCSISSSSSVLVTVKKAKMKGQLAPRWARFKRWANSRSVMTSCAARCRALCTRWTKSAGEKARTRQIWK